MSVSYWDNLVRNQLQEKALRQKITEYDKYSFTVVISQSSDDEPGGYSIRGLRRFTTKGRMEDYVERLLDEDED